jgi:hypothetical protein
VLFRSRNGLVENFRYFETGVHQPSGSVLPYLWFQPTVLGCQLFLAANGHNQRSASEILNDKLMFKAMLDIRMDEVFTASESTKIDPGQIKPPGPIPPS